MHRFWELGNGHRLVVIGEGIICPLLYPFMNQLMLPCSHNYYVKNTNKGLPLLDIYLPKPNLEQLQSPLPHLMLTKAIRGLGIWFNIWIHINQTNEIRLSSYSQVYD